MAASLAPTVIQWDEAFRKPVRLPNATRERTTAAAAPTVVRAIDTRLIRPYDDSEVGSVKIRRR
jgi:hypothetical protein